MINPTIIAAAAIAVFGIVMLAFIAWHGIRTMMRNVGIAFVIIAAGFLYSMATKPPTTWDTYLRDNGTHYTNNYTVACFRWTKTSPLLTDNIPLHIARLPNGGSEWQVVANTTVGALAYDYNLDSTNYTWYVYTDYLPPVHTNGVWIGNVIEKAKGDTGLNKLIIINGRLYRDGILIAPKGD